jgi:hypothetical protein
MTAKQRVTEKPEPAKSEPVKAAKVPGECVVDEPFHVGRAVNGKVCSYHANRYKADGTPR